VKYILILGLSMCPLAACATCFPANDLKIYPSQDFQADAIGHSAFDKAIDLVYAHYAPIVRAKGFNLVFNRLWNDPTVNSDTDVEGSYWVINSYGGLARYPGMNTVAAYASVACHELGHHMGGAPLYTGGRWPGGGASAEGEADYWATKECMKAIGYSDSAARAAGLSVAKVLAKLAGEPLPSPKVIDPRVVRRTYEDHPAAQCRLDTYISGSACPAHGPMSDTNPRVNSCYSYPNARTWSMGSRPRCWFKP
jgi:hypothetical protein